MSNFIAQRQRYINLGIIPNDAAEKTKPARSISTSGRKNYQSTLSNCSLNPFGYDDSQSLRHAQIEWLCHPEAIFYLKIPY